MCSSHRNLWISVKISYKPFLHPPNKAKTPKRHQRTVTWFPGVKYEPKHIFKGVICHKIFLRESGKGNKKSSFSVFESQWLWHNNIGSTIYTSDESSQVLALFWYRDCLHRVCPFFKKEDYYSDSLCFSQGPTKLFLMPKPKQQLKTKLKVSED